jgi:hypothetical protein
MSGFASGRCLKVTQRRQQLPDYLADGQALVYTSHAQPQVKEVNVPEIRLVLTSLAARRTVIMLTSHCTCGEANSRRRVQRSV